MLRLGGVGRFVPEWSLGIVTPFLVKPRRIFAGRLVAVRLALARFAAGRLVAPGLVVTRLVVPGLVLPGLAVRSRRRLLTRSMRGSVHGRPLFRSRLILRAFGERLDTDIVFLVGTTEVSDKFVGRASGNLELGSGIHDADGADISLVDAAAAADHRQQPARFRVLAAGDWSAETDAALVHDVTRRRFSRLRSRSRRPVIPTRRPAVPFPAAILTGATAMLAGIDDVLGRRQPRAIEPRQRSRNILRGP